MGHGTLQGMVKGGATRKETITLHKSMGETNVRLAQITSKLEVDTRHCRRHKHKKRALGHEANTFRNRVK
jgi:hypothetical protein